MIRPMDLRDVDAAVDLFERVAEERLWIGTEPGFDRQVKLDVLGRSVTMGNAGFVAENHGGEIIGMISAYPHDEYGWTLGMMIDAPYRGAGLGRRLVERVIDWARARSIPHLSLLVFPHNERALRLYQSIGFVEIERYENDVTRADGNVWDTVLMRLSLA